MAAVTLTNAASQELVPKIGRAEPTDAVNQRFSAAMERAGADSTRVIQSANTPSKVSPLEGAAAANSASLAADAQERARRALNLNPSAAARPKAVQGDSVLRGLDNIRGVFGAQEAEIKKAAMHVGTDPSKLFTMQIEVAKYSVLVESTSKLAGKVVQASDVLLKGQ